MKTNQLWAAALAELQIQTPPAAFDAWLRTSRLVQHDDGVLVVGVADEQGKQWLERQLLPIIQRTLNRLAGKPIEVTFVVSEEARAPSPEPPLPTPAPKPGEVAIELVEFDPTRRGFVQAPNYAIRFWQPYLATIERETGSRTESVAFNLWLTLSSFAFDATRSVWPSIQTLAHTCAKGNRHAVLGRAARKDRQRVIGALEVLENERIIVVKTLGEGRETSYYFRVLRTLPLLTPQQVHKLHPSLQEAHDRWMKECTVEYDEWKQLALPTLTGLVSGT